MITIRKALILAGFILAFSFGLSQAVDRGWLEPDTMERARGIMAGLVLVLIANLVPKTVERQSGARCDPTRAQKVQRFTGWTLVLAGLGHSIAWLVLPISLANSVAMGLVATGMVLVLARLVWAYTGESHSQPPAGA